MEYIRFRGKSKYDMLKVTISLLRLVKKMSRKIIISPHLPKTAGQSLLQHWVKIFGAEAVCEDYNGTPVRYSDASIAINPGLKRRFKQMLISNPITKSLLSTIQKTRSSLQTVDVVNDDSIKVIHGHFPLEKYKEMFPDADIVVVLRDPWKRALSHFQYWRDEYPRIGNKLPSWFTPETSLERFLEDPEIINIQSQYLGDIRLEDISLIGFTEDFEGFIANLYEKYSEMPIEKEIRENSKKGDLNIPEAELERLHQKFLVTNQKDIELVQNAHKLVEAREMEMIIPKEMQMV